ncbi:hypothetical protein BpHYR1_001202 [Brachionus plicatilis]|uniref:Uncharacterized protein n=1 Tax=Brachionus plicatilis TaxID=10195 RepID=A0A3M7PAM6_BRAPC|nr:hypothetical protein BpHYR1_001202 [Brachionus plicatilis]
MTELSTSYEFVAPYNQNIEDSLREAQEIVQQIITKTARDLDEVFIPRTYSEAGLKEAKQKIIKYSYSIILKS